MDDVRLSAEEAAARLGVKRATLYAYVSRGLLDRTVAIDGRTSLFDPDQVDRLRTRRRRTAVGEVSSLITSRITRVHESGHHYRDRPATELAVTDTSFEQVAELLWGVAVRPADDDHWELHLDDLSRIRAVQNALGDEVPSLDRLRVAVATLSASDPLRHDLSPTSVANAGRRMIAGMVAAMPKLHVGPRGRLADQLWLGLALAPGSDAQRRVLNAALVLLADHGLAASTFAVRVASSVRADPYSAVSTGLGAVGGVLHGAASTAVHRLLQQADLEGADVALGRELSAGRRLGGVGHAVYQHRDRREEVLLDLIRTAWADDPRLSAVLELRHHISERLPQPVNIDFALGALTWLGDMDPSAEAIFAIARTAGWVAHSIEENAESAGRFRPVARYVSATATTVEVSPLDGPHLDGPHLDGGANGPGDGIDA